MPKGKGYGQSSRNMAKKAKPRTTGKNKSGPKMTRPGRKTTK